MNKFSRTYSFFLLIIRMYIAGCQPDVNALFPKIDYPVSRGTPSTATLATWDHSDSWENIGPTRVNYVFWLENLIVLKV